MRLYKTQVGRWSGTQADARTDGSFEQVDVPTDKPGLIAFLNGRDCPEHAATPPQVEQSATAEPMTEDAFEALPLAMQLHLAALALENARDQIKPRNPNLSSEDK